MRCAHTCGSIVSFLVWFVCAWIAQHSCEPCYDCCGGNVSGCLQSGEPPDVSIAFGIPEYPWYQETGVHSWMFMVLHEMFIAWDPKQGDIGPEYCKYMDVVSKPIKVDRFLIRMDWKLVRIDGKGYANTTYISELHPHIPNLDFGTCLLFLFMCLS